MNKPSSTFALALCAAAVSCFGTETDNPVTSSQPGIDYTSPETFGPAPVEQQPPPCVAQGPEEEAYIPSHTNHDVLVSTGRGSIVAVANRSGLPFVDVSDPEAPRVLSRLPVPVVYDLLAGGPGVLWAVVLEPLEVSGPAVPGVEALDFRLRLIQLDVSNPEQPVRVAQAELEGLPWALRARGDELWVVTARRRAAERACDAPEGYLVCRQYYEALVVRGFRPGGGALEPLGQAELPFEQRAWWGTDGIVSALDGALHVLTWDSSGALAAPTTVNVASDASKLGPADVVGRQLLAVRASTGTAALDVYELGAAGAPRSFELGPILAPSVRSLFFGGQLWLQSQYATDPAQIWDLSGPEPARVVLPEAYSVVLPITGATRQGLVPGEVLALGQARDSADRPTTALLSLSGGVLDVIDVIDAADGSTGFPDGSGSSEPAPPGVSGTGSSPRWRLAQPGPGLPLEIEPDAALPFEPVARGTVAVATPAGGLVPATLLNTAVPVGATGYTSQVELVVGEAANTRFEVSEGTSELFATRAHVVTRDSIDPPGVSIFSVSGEPSLVAQLPLPAPPAAARGPLNWQLYDSLTLSPVNPFPLGDERLVFVAEAELSCDTQEACDAIGIEALPIADANVVVGNSVDCPPAILDPDCVSMPAPVPTVYGASRRQYFYVLDLEAPGGPAWQAWGESSLESSTARRDRGGDSLFAAPFATDGVLAATRLERESAAGALLPERMSRFMLDRFARDAQGAPIALPPVNVPGYPLARLGASAGIERWLAVESTGDASGHARLLHLDIEGGAARIEQALALDAGRFAGLRLVTSEQARIGVALLAPADACGTTELSSVRLGADAGDRRLELADRVELPEDNWTFAATDGPYVLLRSYPAYVLVHVAPDGDLDVVGSHTVSNSTTEQLIGTTLVVTDLAGPQRIELGP